MILVSVRCMCVWVCGGRGGGGGLGGGGVCPVWLLSGREGGGGVIFQCGGLSCVAAGSQVSFGTDDIFSQCWYIILYWNNLFGVPFTL